MNDGILRKQRAHAENKKLGMVVCTETTNKYGGENRTLTRESSKTRPANTTTEMFPAGRKSGVCKPGQEGE